MQNQPVVFSFNWTLWPFVETGHEGESGIKDLIPDSLTVELQNWSIYFLENFTSEAGFSSQNSKFWINTEYENLSKKLKSYGVIFTENKWWNESPRKR
jgi:hypothetical protein